MMNANLYNQFTFNAKKKSPLIFLDSGEMFTYENIDQKVAQYSNFFLALKFNQAIELFNKQKSVWIRYAFIIVDPIFETIV